MSDTIDIHSATWRRIEAELKTIIERDRNYLESPALDMSQTEHVRGRISLAKQILKLPTAAKPA
jgi:hypothetical protein